MINYPFARNLEWIHALVCKLFHLLQIIVLCSILQHISDLYCILQQPDCFFENESLWNLFRMTNYPCVPSLEVIHKLVTKMYHLLKIISFCRIFSVFCSILQQPDNFFLSKTYQNQLGITNFPCVSSLEKMHAFVFKLYHLLHVMLFCSIFAAFYSILRKPDIFLITKPIQIN